ncbi:putative RNA polymerase II subunit B1 CTD phosphatase RPAP2 homolog [Paramacrobiotus metropolitanus]|uniref:putative RNA polymerase II subunit B1 CTD phosphatase RPAP2 homolog n=1 Tax=Paramacrobiotus metropolitanus TaxID=2943436 RepID=UPI0024464B98|nr:putative RNA polymerase II subunit B1 CTD phosphatase RPAP2 homolog [Paramacrobiotus metropolitanus]
MEKKPTIVKSAAARSQRKKPAGSAPNKNKEILKAVEGRLVIEKRTREVVLNLIEDVVSTEVLQSAARFISAENYRDIVAERALSGICGYPICSNSFKNTAPFQKFRIDSKNNKIYDISDRKNYCSSDCYAASLVYEKQLSEVPVWLREKEPVDSPQVLIPGEIRGVQGVAVNLTDPDLDSLNSEIQRMKVEDSRQTEVAE